MRLRVAILGDEKFCLIDSNLLFKERELQPGFLSFIHWLRGEKSGESVLTQHLVDLVDRVTVVKLLFYLVVFSKLHNFFHCVDNLCC